MLKTAIRLVQLGVALAKNREVLAYLFFGVLTTIVNTLCYSVLDRLGLSTLAATFLAWLIAVIFAFITNRKYVFRADRSGGSAAKQFFGFFFARSFTGILDLVIMYLAVDVYGMNGTLWKLISNVIVVVLNYFFSKLLVFRKPKTLEAEPETRFVPEEAEPVTRSVPEEADEAGAADEEAPDTEKASE
jgi:putative flippase GtrA